MHGVPRLTNDADILVDISTQQVTALVRELEAEFYVSEDAVQSAVRDRTSFNAIHRTALVKVDLFLLREDPLDIEQMRSRRVQTIGGQAESFIYVTSPEVLVLRKLAWYRDGGKASDRQMNDVLGILKVQRNRLDLDYLRGWADRLGLRDLLDRTFRMAGS